MHIEGPWLESGGVTMTAILEVDGKVFYKMAKWDHRVIRLLTGHCRKEQNPLSSKSNDYLDRLAAARDEARTKLEKELQPPAAEHDIGLDKPDEVDVSRLLPKFITIDTPPINDVVLSVRVLCNATNQPLWVELTPDVLEHMHKAYSVDENQPAKKHKARPKPYFDKSRQAFRVKYVEDGNAKIKDFRPADDSEESRTVALQEATVFSSSLQ